MPLYDYRCPVCNRGREVHLKLAELETPIYCCNCGAGMNRKISAVAVRGDYAPYECPVTGKLIEGRRQHEENLKRTGCRILEPGETQSYKKSLEQAEIDFDRKLDETADRLIQELPSDKKEKLAAEMEGGLNATVERSTPTF